MEVKKGYKQTEVGIIPDDWDITTIGNVADISSGTTPSRALEERYYGNGTIAWVKTLDLNNSEIYSTDEKVTQIALNETSLKIYPEGTVLVAMYGGFNQIGRTGLLRTPATINQALTAVKPNAKILVSEYLLRVLNHRVKYWKSVASSSRKDPNITGTDVRKFPLALPKIEEQKAIAEALSDADALIEALDGLVAKKRQVKQGAMQELLTGKRRLPGFTDDWDTVPLKSISSMHGRIGWQGLKQTEFTMKAEDPYLITGMNFKDGEIRWDEVYHVPWERYEMAKEIQLKTGDVLMTKDGTIGKMLYVDEIPYPGKATLNSHLLVFRPMNNKYIPKFLFYQMNSKAFYNHIEQEKSGTTFFGITQEAVGKYNAFLPSIPEQTAIAEILSDMDAEITALEGKLSKARQVKQGMMSVLLTGRVRLV